MGNKAPIILVTGGRDYHDAAKVHRMLESYKPRGIIQGGATGADQIARIWAETNGVANATVMANWAVHSRAAGAIRNGWMLELCKVDFVLAFPGGKGTADMVRQAKAAGIDVVEVG